MSSMDGIGSMGVGRIIGPIVDSDSMNGTGMGSGSIGGLGSMGGMGGSGGGVAKIGPKQVPEAKKSPSLSQMMSDSLVLANMDLESSTALPAAFGFAAQHEHASMLVVDMEAGSGTAAASPSGAFTGEQLPLGEGALPDTVSKPYFGMTGSYVT